MVIFELSFAGASFVVGGAGMRRLAGDPVPRELVALSLQRCADPMFQCCVTLWWWAGSEEGPGSFWGGAGRDAAIFGVPKRDGALEQRLGPGKEGS